MAADFPSADNGGISADGKTITIKLKPNLKWQDGQPLGCDDAVFTLAGLHEPQEYGYCEQGRLRSDRFHYLPRPTDNRHQSSRTSMFPGARLFVYPNPGFLPTHLLKGKDSLDNDPFVRMPVGSGPFKVTEVKAGDHITLQAADTYWKGRPHLDTINIKIVPSRDAGNAALATGDVDLVADEIEANIPDLDALQPKAHAIAQPSQDFEHYFFNLGTKANGGIDGPIFWQDPDVRKAYIMCIDRDTIASKLLYGKTRVIATLWPNSEVEDTSIKPYPYDPDAANALLDKAGWVKGDDGIRVKTINGKPVRLSFNHETTTGNRLRADVQVFATSTLRGCGMEMLPQNFPSGTLFGTFAQDGPLTVGRFDTGGYTTSFTPDPDPVTFLTCDGIATKDHPDGQNTWRLCDKELDQWTKDEQQEPDPAKRKAIFAKMQQKMYDQAFMAPLYNRLKVVGASNRIQNIKSSPITDVYWSAWDWAVSQ